MQVIKFGSISPFLAKCLNLIKFVFDQENEEYKK